MKWLAALVSLAGSCTALAAPRWSVDLDRSQNLVEQGIVQLSIQTQQIYSSMCVRSLRSVKLTPPLFFESLLEEPVTHGRIELETYVSPLTPCLMAIGPHHATLSLLRGKAPPALVNGIYALQIDGEDLGLLELAEDDVRMHQSPAPHFQPFP